MKEKTKTENKRKILNWILNIILIILAIIGVYLFLARIFGSSPTDFHLLLWISGFFGTAILKIFSMIYGLNRETGELKIGVKSSFKKFKTDISEIKQDINNIKQNINKFGGDVQDIKENLKRKGRKIK